ncbi:MAG TPA: DUF4240 domain-containing protein [Lacunisphaera sp.]|jgi:hypothetical protein
MLHGTYYFGRKRVACRNAYCTTCRAPRFAEGFRSLVVLHVFFIPFLPIATTVRWFCSTCKKEIDAKRPSRPWILITGILFGLFMTFIGVMMLFDRHEKETALGALIFGPLMVIGLAYMIRKQDYRGYIGAQENVPPLPGDHCPYCKAPVFAAKTPHCHACKVDIITKAPFGSPVAELPSVQKKVVLKQTHSATKTDEFWKIIEAARAGAKNGEADMGAIKRNLKGMKAEDVQGFDSELQRRRAESYRWDLWAVAYIVNGGCSDDGFDYFRGWLISKGRKYFETAMADPTRAADDAERDANECEDLLYIPASVYEEKTGRVLPKSEVSFPSNPVGKAWEEDELEGLYPALWARFS